MRKRMIHIALVVFALACMGTVWVLTSPTLALRRIEIYGLENLTEDDVLKKLPFSRGDNLLLISTAAAERRLAADGRIDSVSVRRSFPDGVIIWVHEKKPVYLLNCGTLWGISRDGVAIPIDDPRRVASLPVINVAENYSPLPYRPVVDSSVVRSVAFLNRIAETDPDFLDRISEISSPEAGQFSLVLVGSGIEVKMSDDPAELEKLGVIIANLDTDTISPYEIDLRFPGQGIVRFKPKMPEDKKNAETENG